MGTSQDLRLVSTFVIAAALLAASLASPRLSMEARPSAALYATVRSLAQDTKLARRTPKELEPAVAAARALEATLPDEVKLPSGLTRRAIGPNDRRVKDVYWGLIDSQAFSAPRLALLPDRFADFPAKVGGFWAPGEELETFARSLSDAEKAGAESFLSSGLKGSQGQIEWFKERVEPQWPAIYADLEQAFGFEGPPGTIRILVVPSYPIKGGITLRTLSGPLVVIATDRFKESDFAECAIHESIHALDTGARASRFLAAMREELKVVTAPDLVKEQGPHAAFFAAAGDMVRAHVQPRHRDLGEKLGVYQRGLGPFLDPIRTALKSERDRSIAGAVAARSLSRLAGG